jgi:hypothetical protein
MLYRCAHCFHLLDEGAACPNHPDGVVEALDAPDPE